MRRVGPGHNEEVRTVAKQKATARTMKTATKKKKTARKAPRKTETVLVLRTCDADMNAYDGFKWPKRGRVEAPDWDPEPVCGYGLHGLLRGEGDVSLLNDSDAAKWLAVEVDASTVIDLGGKVKFPAGRVVYCGDRDGAVRTIQERHPDAACVHGTATAGSYGTATAGYRGTATAGSYGTATAGDGGTATAGYRGTATAGDGGTATAGYRGTATAGFRGEIRVRWWDGQADRYRTAIAYVGEDGIVAGRKYRCEAGKIVEVTS
jgi:hypothetical protein